MEDIKEKHKTAYKSKDSKISKQIHILEETTETGEKQYHCTACGKTFRSRSQKYYHLNCNQLQDMIYKCDHCDKCFSRHSQWKYHVESHTSPINECTKCRKTFSNPLALKKHEALHKVKPKPCPHCDKTFQKKISLDQHISGQHLNQLQFGCAYCNKKYASKSTLHLHLQSHEKKRFECTICGKLFQRNSILNLHLKRHSNTNNYTCPACNKVFSESGALSRHRKIHQENVLQYHCKLCDKNILRKDNMIRHLNTIHPEEKFVEIVDVLRSTQEKIDSTNKLVTESDNEMINNKETNNIEKQISLNITTSLDKCIILENKIIQNPIKILNDTSEISNPTMITSGHVSCTNINVTDQLIGNQIEVITPVPPHHYEKEQISCNIENSSQELQQYQIMEPQQQQLEKATYTQQSDIRNYSQAQEILGRHMEFIELSTDILNSSPELSQNQTEHAAKENDTLTTPEIQHYFLFNDSKNTNEIENCFNFSKITPSTTNSNASQLLYPIPKGQENNRNKTQNSSVQFDIDGKAVTQAISSVIKSIGNVKKKLTPTIAKESKPTSNVEIISKPTLCSLNLEYKHKKYSRNNYDIDLYRKILGCDDEDDSNNYSENDEQQHRSVKLLNNTENAVSTPVHWRKSFKNNYETSAL